MRLASIATLVILLASAAPAQLNPGFIVHSGDPFPIAADVNRDGLDDLVQEKSIIINHGGTLSDVRSLGRAGKFRNSGGDDLYIMGTLIWGAELPRPRLYGADSVGSGGNTSAVRVPSRGRASRPLPIASDDVFQMQIHGDCVGELAAGQITFARDGVFGVAQRDDVKIEALFDEPSIYLRITGPTLENIWGGVITKTGGVYSGTMIVRSQSCGIATLTITATPR